MGQEATVDGSTWGLIHGVPPKGQQSSFSGFACQRVVEESVKTVVAWIHVGDVVAWTGGVSALVHPLLNGWKLASVLQASVHGIQRLIVGHVPDGETSSLPVVRSIPRLVQKVHATLVLCVGVAVKSNHSAGRLIVDLCDLVVDCLFGPVDGCHGGKGVGVVWLLLLLIKSSLALQEM